MQEFTHILIFILILVIGLIIYDTIKGKAVNNGVVLAPRDNKLNSSQSKRSFWIGFLWSFLTGILLGAVILLTISRKYNEAEKKEVWRGYKISVAL